MARMDTVSFGLVLGCTALSTAGCGTLALGQLGLDTAGLFDGEAHEKAVYQLLEGDFDSSGQATKDSGYDAISLRMCGLEVPDIGERVLYVEQAFASRLEAPYRQRLYSVEAINGQVAVLPFTLADQFAVKMINACDRDDLEQVSEVIDSAWLTEELGCTLWLESDGDGTYAGGTDGTLCSTTIGDAVFTTTEVVLESMSISLWDRGWVSENRQVWGAVDGPYTFKRVN